MKKALKITGLSLLILIALLAVAPFIFQSQIKDMLAKVINNNINAQVEFSYVRLSFFRSFPQANVNIDDLKISNFEPFKGDTLALVKSLSFDMSVKELFKTAKEDPIIINAIAIDEAFIQLKTNAEGQTNFDLAKENKEQAAHTDSETSGFAFNIEDYNISDSDIHYIDESSKTILRFNDFNHRGQGQFSESLSELDTHTDTYISLSIDSTAYLNENSLKLDAIIGLDLDKNIYSFKDNKALINQLPLEFYGQFQQLENGQEVDISFKNPGASFKDFLAIIPEGYSKNISQVETTGDFTLNGEVKGLISDESIPKFDIQLLSNNAAFKYPDLPKRVEDIKINATLKNLTGKADDSYLDLQAFNFKIDEDVFKSSATVKQLTKNILINANIDGSLNLANISKAYPIDLEHELSGILKGKINTSFDMNALENNAYERIKNNGTINISDFVFSSEDIVNPIHIQEADINFDPKTVRLTNFKAKTGTTDLDATGTIDNLLGFLLSNKKLKGDFKVQSEQFAVSDFMVEGTKDAMTNGDSNTKEALKIPAFLDCNITADAKTVLYDNLSLKNVKGQLLIRDEQAHLQNMSSSLFDGQMTMSGMVDTQNPTALFDMDLGVSNFDISKSFNGLELLQNLAPIAKALQGKLNSSIKLSGQLGEDFTPHLNSVSGDALAELLSTTVSHKETALFSSLSGVFNFIDFEQLDLKDIKTKLNFKDGQVSVSPFKLQYKDIGITVEGAHGFDKTLNYNAVFNVPASYLGSEITDLLASIDDEAVNNISIPVTAKITGTFNTPTVTSDLKSGIGTLTTQLIEIKKQKLLNTGKDKLNDLIGDVLGGSSSETDNNETTEDSTPSDPIKDVLGDILGGQTKPQDSIANETEPQANPVKDIIGIFGSKKKKKTDSLN